VFIGLRRDARQFVSEFTGSVGTLAVPLGQLLAGNRSFDNELPRLFVDHDVVSSLDSEPFPEFLGNCHLASLPDFPAFALTHTYSYLIHTNRPSGGNSQYQPYLGQIELDEIGIVDTPRSCPDNHGDIRLRTCSPLFLPPDTHGLPVGAFGSPQMKHGATTCCTHPLYRLRHY
jgi:hypothetical protein